MKIHLKQFLPGTVLSLRCLLLCTLICLLAPALTAQQWQRQPRISGELGSGNRVPLAGSVHHLAHKAQDLGRMQPGLQLSMTMNFAPSPAEQKQLQALLEAQQNPSSLMYHRWLSQEEFGERFGLTESDLQRVTAWLAAEGFTLTGVSPSRNAVYFTGSVGQIESSFRTQMHHVKVNGEAHVTNLHELQIPETLSGMVLNVRGLNSFKPKPQHRFSPKPAYTVQGSSSYYNFLLPSDWATIYNVNALYTKGYTGSGMHVGVVGQTYAPPSDVINFRTQGQMSNASSPLINYKCIDLSASASSCQSPLSNQGDLSEADLDIEWAGGIAKDATVDFIYAPWSDTSGGIVDPNGGSTTGSNGYTVYYDVFDALRYAVEDYKVSGKVLPVISMSYSDCEADFYLYDHSGNVTGTYTGYVDWVTKLGMEANSQGQTLVVASGDTGAAGCDSGNYPAQVGLFPAIPADSPYYTAVGGTEFYGDSNNSTYWNETSFALNSAKQYIPEEAWNDTSSIFGLSASGGGVSAFYAQPSWQPTPLNYTGTAGRFYPDVAFSASPAQDAYLICSQGDNSPTYGTMCDPTSTYGNTPFVSSNGYFDAVGGTSAGTPAFAGMLTLLLQATGSSGFSNINQTLYQLAYSSVSGNGTLSSSYSTIFHDITLGNNIVPCAYGTAYACPSSGQMGYSAETGFDMVTGLGSVNAGALLTALTTTHVNTTTTLTALPGSLAINNSVTLSAVVKASDSSAPSGSVVFSLNGTSLGSVSVSGSASQGYGGQVTITATSALGFATGSNTVKASYSGDLSHNASSGTTTVTITAPLAQTITFNNPGTQTYGTSLTLTATASSGLAVSYTVTSGSAIVNGSQVSFTGTGQVTVQATQAGNSSYAAATPVSQTFTVSPAALVVTPNNMQQAIGTTIALSGTMTPSASATAASSDGISATYSTTATTSSNIGTYPITAKLNDPNSRLGYYTVTLNTGKLTLYNPNFPLLLALSSYSTTANATGFTLTLTGANFTSGSHVLWNGSALAGTYVNATQLQATVPTALLANPGTAMITVTNASPAGSSQALAFTIFPSAQPLGTITGYALEAASGGGYVLTLTGSGFCTSSCSVAWNGTALTTTLISSTTMSAAVSATQYASRPATVTITASYGSSRGFVIH